MQHVDAWPAVLVGRYELGEVIGRGGMSEVHRAHDRRLHRDVAVKVLRPDVALRDDARRRFEVEARAAATVNHPNVVSVLDVAEQDGVPFIVLECLPGRTLAHELAGGAMSSGRVRRLGLEVLAGLAAAHRLGVLHRDIKPSNILLTDAGVAKLADFGIAKVADGFDLTETGEVLGTLQYMAPERLAGAPATPASDTYGVGIVLYEVLTADPPFGAGSPATLTYAIVHRDLQPVATGRADIDAGLAAVVDRAVRRDPTKRFASAEEMAEALAEVVDAGTQTLLDRPAGSGSESDTAVGVGEAVTVRAMAATSAFSAAVDDSHTSVLPSPPSRSHSARRSPMTLRSIALVVAAAVAIAMLAAFGAVTLSRSGDLTPATTPSTASTVPTSVVLPSTTAVPSSAPPTSAAPAGPITPGKGADKPGRGDKGNKD